MKTRTPDQVLDEIARDQIGQEINLSSGIQAKMRKGYEKQMKTKKLLAGAAALVLVLVVLFSIPSVAKAIGRLFGYVPGTGFVDQSAPIRVLKEPVVFKSGVTTITVSQALIDSEHTTVSYQIENFPDTDATDLQFEDFCHALPSLVREDGSYLDPNTIGGNSWASGLSRQLEYDALRADENSVTLEFACLEALPISADAPKIQMRLDFVAASAEMTSFPLVDLPTPTLQASETAALETQVSPISLVLNKYVQTDQEIILFGAVRTDATDFMLTYVDSAAVHLIDKDGNAIPIEEDYTLPDPETETMVAAQEVLITYRTAGRYIPGEASLVIDSLWVDRAAEASFTFDPGPDPQPGQTWTINQTLDVNGHSILIKEVTKTLRGEGLDVSYETPENISMLRLNDLEHPQLGGGGGSESSGFTYDNGFPTGEITVTLTGYAELITGPWQTAVTLPAFADGTLPTPMPQACLTEASWNAALQDSVNEIPSGLSGKLILANPWAPDYYYHVLSADLNSSSPTDLGNGNSGALSADGETLVYASDDGLKLLNLTSGEVTILPDTSKRDQGPIWSADGIKIAFTRGPVSGLVGGGAPGPYDLMVMDADGSNQTVLLSDNNANYAQTWMPFSKTLLYTVKRPEGSLVKTINTETGETSELFTINYQNAGVAVSPNGRLVAYEAMLPGEKYGVYVASLDGTNPRLIANGDPIVVTEPYWSPDGEWLIMSVQDMALNENSATLALVNPTSCQIIPLTSLTGYVTEWR